MFAASVYELILCELRWCVSSCGRNMFWFTVVASQAVWGRAGLYLNKAVMEVLLERNSMTGCSMRVCMMPSLTATSKLLHTPR